MAITIEFDGQPIDEQLNPTSQWICAHEIRATFSRAGSFLSLIALFFYTSRVAHHFYKIQLFITSLFVNLSTIISCNLKHYNNETIVSTLFRSTATVNHHV